MIDKSFQWKKSAACAVVATLGFWLSDASALSLGRITVQSALGEPLRAEIDVPVITAEESTSLVVTVAAPSAFSAAGMEYSAVLGGAQISLLKRSDGRSFLRLSSDRPVNDAFMDIILEATWSSGRIVRDFTLLLDPPSLRQTSAPTPATTQLPAAAPATAPAAVAAAQMGAGVDPTAQAAVNAVSGAAAQGRNTPAIAVAVAPKPVTAVPTTRENAVRAPQIVVKPGDTAGRIAAAHKPAHVSLDQMLVALLRSNPNAFVDKDLNRIKAGAVLELPLQNAQDTDQAPRTLLAQSKDFNDYRSKVATNAPQAAVVPADRQASGKVQTSVQDDKTGVAPPDKLTLSKGAVRAGNGENQLAKERSLQEAADKAAALARNIEELNKLKAAPGVAAPDAGASGPAAPVPSGPALPAPPVAPAASKTKPASSAPLAGAEDGILQSLTGDPAAPIWAASLIALLAALGIYRVRQRKKEEEESEEPSFLASRLKPDSFFSAPADQAPASDDDPATGSSLLNPSSLARAAGESDPLAEADVYLAYGRDAQAEEVLREALSARPELPGIHLKLLEILAKRRDLEAFESVAQDVRALHSGQGEDWERTRDLGRSIDPINPLYQDPVPALHADLPTQAAEIGAQPAQMPDATALDLDLNLDLDFSLDEGSTGSPPPAEPGGKAFDSPTQPLLLSALPEVQTPLEPEIEFDLDLGTLAVAKEVEPAESTTPQPAIEMPDLSFDTTELRLNSRSTEEEATQEATPSDDGPITNPGALEFDFGSLSLELDTPEFAAPGTQGTEAQDVLATKLALADEFAAIGDHEGARALIREVIAQASGDLQAQAQQALKKL